MKIKDDYCQSKPEVRICTDPQDEHIEVWWFVKNEDGDVYPVELQMSSDGARNLATNLFEACHKLFKAKYKL